MGCNALNLGTHFLYKIVLPSTCCAVCAAALLTGVWCVILRFRLPSPPSIRLQLRHNNLKLTARHTNYYHTTHHISSASHAANYNNTLLPYVRR